MFDLESNVRSWSDYLRGRGNLKELDIIELESHLQDEIDDLVKSGLSAEEAFLISVKRLGNVNAISQEFSKVKIEKWQTHYLYVYALWLGIVAFIFPLIFGFN